MGTNGRPICRDSNPADCDASATPGTRVRVNASETNVLAQATAKGSLSGPTSSLDIMKMTSLLNEAGKWAEYIDSQVGSGASGGGNRKSELAKHHRAYRAHVSTRTISGLKTALLAANRISSLEDLARDDPVLRKIAVTTDVMLVPVELATQTFDTALGIAAEQAFKSGSLEQWKMATGAQEAIEKYIGKPLAMLSVATSAISLVSAVREGNSRGVADATTNLVSAGVGLALIGRGGGVASFLVQWYSQGVTIMGELGGILNNYDGSHIKRLERMFKSAALLQGELVAYGRRFDKLVDGITLRKPWPSPSKDSLLIRSSIDIARHLADIHREFRLNILASSNAEIDARDLELTIHSLPMQKDLEKQVKSQLDFARLKPIEFEGGVVRYGVNNVLLGYITCRAVFAVIRTDLIMMNKMKSDSKEAKSFRKLYAPRR